MLHITKVKPLYTNIVTTGDKFEKDMTNGSFIIARAGDLKLWQTVIAVGSSVRDIKLGDKVMINPANYMVRKYDKNSIQNDMNNNPVIDYKFNWITIEDDAGTPHECLLLSDRDVDYVFEGEEKEDSIFIPNTPKLILS